VGTRDPASVVDIRSIVIPGFGGKGRIVGVISETTRATPVTVGRLAPSPSWATPQIEEIHFRQDTADWKLRTWKLHAPTFVSLRSGWVAGRETRVASMLWGAGMGGRRLVNHTAALVQSQR